jgi:hypothetical protein
MVFSYNLSVMHFALFLSNQTLTHNSHVHMNILVIIKPVSVLMNYRSYSVYLN